MEDRIYRIIDPVKGPGMLYTLEQLKHLKNNHKINADTYIIKEGETDPIPAGALFDFTPAAAPFDNDVNMLGIVSVVLIFFFPLAGLITSIIGFRLATVRDVNRNTVLTALIINASIVLIQILIIVAVLCFTHIDNSFSLKHIPNNVWSI